MMISESTLRNGKPSYLVRVKDRFGRQMPAKSFSLVREAKAYEAMLKTKVNGGVTANSEQLSKVRFQDVLAKWQDEFRGGISEAWVNTQAQLIRDYISPELDHYKFSDIQPHHIRSTLLAMEKRGLSPQTRRHVFSILHKVFKDFIEEYGLNMANPVITKLKPEVPQKRRNHLRTDESRLLLQYVRNHYLGPAIWLGLLAGMRSEAIIALRNDSLDFVHREILIKAGYKKNLNRIEDYPKGKDWERVVMVPDLAAFLSKTTANKSKNDFVCTGPSGDMLRYEHFKHVLKRLCRELRITEVTPHELRHSMPELFYEAGASDEDVRQMLTHKDVSTTLLYKHRSSDRLHFVATKVHVQPRLEAV